MKDESAGLLAAAFIGIVPGYISRSVAGSYDNEAIAIFLLMFTFFLWIKAMKQGSALYGTLAAVFYFYMVAAWGKFLLFGTDNHGSHTFRRWLRIHHEHDPVARSRPHTDGPLHKPSLCGLLVMVRYRHIVEHAGTLRWVPARPYQ
jgi:hypothetical protein